ncbi:uncharacterized protein LOC126818536 [Patella vulgata]|uniref:uncharacterized protein LOC126818536 n=1 Tax=Patella vulgata TaxID=6465 RepID=UPI0024A80B61|nr:uncharacterized protein LOC126818536 [Patella vulgata]
MNKFCSDCSQEICCKCMEDHHRDHNVEDLQDVQSTLVKEIQQLMQDLKERISVIQSYVESIKTELTVYDDATETVCKEVDEQVQKICDATKKLGDHFKSQLQRTKTEERTALVNILERRQSDIYNIQSSLVYTKELMKDKSVVTSNDAIKRLMTLKTETDCDSSEALPSLNTASFTPSYINIDLLYQLLGALSNDVDDGVLEHVFDLTSIRLDCSKWFYSPEQQIKNTRWRIGLKHQAQTYGSIEIGLSYEGGGDFRQILCKFTVEISTPKEMLLSYPDQHKFSCKQIYVLPTPGKSSSCETWTIRVRINRIDESYGSAHNIGIIKLTR